MASRVFLTHRRSRGVPVAAVDQACIGLSRVADEEQRGADVSDIVSIGEGVGLLGVSDMTLRRWDKAGKFCPHRHPVNGYRVYRRATVLELRKRIESGASQ